MGEFEKLKRERRVRIRQEPSSHGCRFHHDQITKLSSSRPWDNLAESSSVSSATTCASTSSILNKVSRWMPRSTSMSKTLTSALAVALAALLCQCQRAVRGVVKGLCLFPSASQTRRDS